MSQLKSKLASWGKRAVLNSHGSMARFVMLARYCVSHRGTDPIGETISRFMPAEQRADTRLVRQTRQRIRQDMRRYLITPDEYFLYGFEHLSEDEKHQFVGDLERSFLCSRLYNSSKSGLIFMDKMATYDHFKEYFKREVISVEHDDDFESYRRFCEAHPVHIVKPSNASRGSGIYREDVSRSLDELMPAFKKMQQVGKCVVEECIVQGEEMARFHPDSVNTIRYATYLEGDDLTVVACFVKLGRGSSVVDNGGAGGLLAAVDPQTGVIISAGRSEYGDEYTVHPDTNVPILGAQVPQWREACELAVRLAHVLPDQKYVGWDLAYSDRGWVMVEGNSGGQFVGPQISLKTGVRPLIDKTFGPM